MREGLRTVVASNPVLTKFREAAWLEKINCDFRGRKASKAKLEWKAAQVCS